MKDFTLEDMTKQEKIREGMAKRIHIQDRVLLKLLDEVNPNNCMWEELGEYQRVYYYRDADRFLKFLKSQGVKFVEEPPSIWDGKGEVMSALEYKKKLVIEELI